MNIWTIILSAGGAIVGVWAALKYVILITARVDPSVYKTLYKVRQTRPKCAYIITEDYVIENKYPIEFKALFTFKGCPWFILTHGERLLTAGWQSKDNIDTITCLRCHKNKIAKYLNDQFQEMQLAELGVSVEVITPYYIDKIGALKEKVDKPVINETIYEDFEEDIRACIDGKMDKTSALFYGPPGCGKTYLIKYLAVKYNLPIRIFTLTPDYTNYDLMCMFSQITPKTIVLFEDFDNLFDGRKCIIGTENMNIKFTFDGILNGLDGVYNTYKGNIFIMTANDIDKIDYALKNRPSRFKYLKKIDLPDEHTKLKLLPEEWLDAVEGMNLDQVVMMKNFYQKGLNQEEALSKMAPEPDEELVKQIAQKRYEERVQKKIEGTAEDDWDYAKIKLGID